MREPSTVIKLLIKTGGYTFSRELGINLSSADRRELSKWFLAAKLFGARISSKIAARTYREFERRKILLPEQVVAAGWHGLVEALDVGGYVRYDFSTASKLLAIMEDLQDRYDGDLNNLHEQAHDEKDLEFRLKSLGKGIGDVTVSIFLRELRSLWTKARPSLSPSTLLAARNLGLIGEGESLVELERLWAEAKTPGADFRDFEAALLRVGKDYCKRSGHNACPLRSVCEKS